MIGDAVHYQPVHKSKVVGPDHPEYITAEAQFRLRCGKLPVPEVPLKLRPGSDHSAAKKAATRLMRDKKKWASYNKGLLMLVVEAWDMAHLKVLFEHMPGCRVGWKYFLPALERRFQENDFFDAERVRAMLSDKGLSMKPKLRTFLNKFLRDAYRSA